MGFFACGYFLLNDQWIYGKNTQILLLTGWTRFTGWTGCLDRIDKAYRIDRMFGQD
jgi:hypothetical protein